MACHHMDLPFWALGLRVPSTIEAEGPPVHPECCPPRLTVRYEFAARQELPPVKLTWYQGGLRPPHFREKGMLPKWGDGCLFIGQKGMLLADYRRRVLLPEADFLGFEPPKPFIPSSIVHHREWIETCMYGGRTTCYFDYGDLLTEAVLLGNVAYRVGKKIEWDSKNLKVLNAPEADQFLKPPHREGWFL